MQIHAKYQGVSNYFKENNWHAINEEPLTDEELKILDNEKPVADAGTVSNLPVVYKQVTENFDQDKPTIIISHTQVKPKRLRQFCEFLDSYIQSLPDETKNKYNILVAVSTSAEDMLGALKKLKQIIGDRFSQAKFLFLNNLKINRRIKNGYEESDIGGEDIIKIARQFIGENALIKTLIRSGKCLQSRMDYVAITPRTYWTTSRHEAIDDISKKFTGSRIPWTFKSNFSENDVTVPIDAFLKFLHLEENDPKKNMWL